MTKFFSLCLLVGTASVTTVFGQTFTEKEHNANTYVYLGVQANQLFRQIFNFSNSNTPLNNPYLLTIGINSKSTGWGVNMSHGYTYSQSRDGDGITSRETNINDHHFRIGFEKKSFLAPKLMISWGIDAVAQKLKDKTTTSSDQGQGGDFKISNSTSRTGGGVGPRVALNYFVGSKILIGTESNYYFISGNDRDITKTTFNGTTQENSNEREKFKTFQFNPPVVIFLILRL